MDDVRQAILATFFLPLRQFVPALHDAAHRFAFDDGIARGSAVVLEQIDR